MAETRNCTPYAALVFFFLFYLLVIDLCCQCRGENTDDTTMYELTRSLYGVPSNWKPQLDPCTWDDAICSRDRVIAINLAQSGISGSLSPTHGNLTSLTSLQLEFNNICGPLPRLSKLSSLRKIYLQANSFDSIPSGFFIGLSSLQEISLDDLPLTTWSLSQDITSATRLVYFSAINAYHTGLIPDFLGSLSSLDILHLSYNLLTSPLPSSFVGSILTKLFLDHQQSRDKISDCIGVIGAIPQLTMV
ncbi:hypothetical protein ZIOFF_046869 [Zingiber officinale]|uniref:Leucine-rich repeat-containing N-terminal plant-type domain-containing protein n=1 Tax=Zingiber officinale TaxID=94328 RepID=A0A8J5KV55_ZINOF|nr:hypothetical protein ZIOFF_046869 [Zingiber officinale]